MLGLLFIITIASGLMHAAQPQQQSIPYTQPPVQLPPLPTPPTPTTVNHMPTPPAKSGLSNLSSTALLASVRLLIESRSVELLVEQLQGITPDATHAFMQELINQPRAMDADEVIQVAYGLLMYFAHQKELREQAYQMLDLISTTPMLSNRPPLLVIAAHSSYPNVIPLILHWAQYHAQLAQCIEEALIFIADNLDLHMLKVLEQNGVHITPERAAIMLWYAAQTKLSPAIQQDDEELVNFMTARKEFVDFLITKKPDVNYQRDGYTALMKAALNNDANTLEQLIKAGADVNLIIDDHIGSALQLAIGHDALDAELMLRRYHAHE